MAIRCGDCNPRRLIRIFNALLLSSRRIKGRGQLQQLRKSQQTEILITFSDQTLAAVKSEPKHGKELFSFLTMVGGYMKDMLHNEPLKTDQVSSIIVEDHISDAEWNLIQRGVALGLLFPNINQNNPDELPMRHGIFHLSYALAPHFRLLPRRGKARSLGSIKKARIRSGPSFAQYPLFSQSAAEDT